MKILTSLAIQILVFWFYFFSDRFPKEKASNTPLFLIEWWFQGTQNPTNFLKILKTYHSRQKRRDLGWLLLFFCISVWIGSWTNFFGLAFLILTLVTCAIYVAILIVYKNKLSEHDKSLAKNFTDHYNLLADFCSFHKLEIDENTLDSPASFLPNWTNQTQCAFHALKGLRQQLVLKAAVYEKARQAEMKRLGKHLAPNVEQLSRVEAINTSIMCLSRFGLLTNSQYPSVKDKLEQMLLSETGPDGEPW